MRNSRRKDLSSITYEQAQHAGLWLDRYIRTQERESKESRHDFVNEVASIHESPLYDPFFQRWRAALDLLNPKPLCRKVYVDGRMIVGIGTESVLETSISLHRTYGVPYIPGSALKGLAVSYVRRYLCDTTWGTWEKNAKGEPVWKAGKEHVVLFGNTENAGYITFFDALYVPGSGYNQQPLHTDVITVHHEGYYQEGTKPPADWDSPTPVPFLSATGSYLVAVSGPPDQDNGNGWAIAAMKLLRLALKEMGVGAKTSSGYGRLTLDSEQPATKYTPPDLPDASVSRSSAHTSSAPESTASKTTGAANLQNKTTTTSELVPTVGTIVTGNRAGFLRSKRDGRVRVKLNKYPARFVGVLPAEEAGGQATGGIKARVVRHDVQGDEIHVVLERLKKDV